MTYHVPDFEPDSISANGSFDIGEVSRHQISNNIEVKIEAKEEPIQVRVISNVDDEKEALSVVVPWCRDYGVPGVKKERLSVRDKTYRLGALYLHAGFELTERETNYEKYGERSVF